MLLLPLAFALVAAVVVFAATSYILLRYRRRYENEEVNAALIIACGAFVLLCFMFYGEKFLRGQSGEEAITGLMIAVAGVTALFVYRVFRSGKRSSSNTDSGH